MMMIKMMIFMIIIMTVGKQCSSYFCISFHKIYKEFEDVKEFFESGVYKYSVGMMSDKTEAIKLQGKLRQQGYKDAFVIAFLNDKKISVKQANEKSLKK